jgi:4-alpha-glucanotransferase
MATSLYGDDWKKWPEDLINPNKNTLKDFKEENKKEYSYQLFVPFLFTKPLKKLNEYGSRGRVPTQGDVPIYTN